MKKALIAAVVVVILAMAGIMVYLLLNNRNLEQEKMEMLELAELDKQEMENDYERLTLQYTEMMNSINNDSIIAQLTQEQMRTQQLLEELKNVKAADAREITRLKKELATVREVLRSYIRQVDSLNQVNQSLMAENDRVKDQLAQSNQANEGLRMEKQNLTREKAEQVIESVDKARDNYVLRYTGQSRFDARNYNIVLNMDYLTEDKAVELILGYLGK